MAESHDASTLFGVTITKWSGLTQNYIGNPISIANHSDKTIQIYGVFGTASVRVQGSNDTRVDTDPENAEWYTLTNTAGDSLIKSAAGGWVIMDNPVSMRIKIEGGDGTTDITASMCSRR